MIQTKRVWPIFAAALTVFFASACIMAMELVAGRWVARHLGQSIYTWTSVIGVVLAGITIGNAIGGWIADVFVCRKTVAVLLCLSSMSCVLTIFIHHLILETGMLALVNWPMRVFLHITGTFLLPSTLLGMINPVVAKMALDEGLATGQTIGDIYAAGAAGSIAGTFLAGFYLITVLGTNVIIWLIAGALALWAIYFWKQSRMLYAWAGCLIVLAVLAMAPTDGIRQSGAAIYLRETPDPNILYEDESPYCYIGVRRFSENPDKRNFMQDTLRHSILQMDDIRNLQSCYACIYAAVTDLVTAEKQDFSALVIGGGGYVLPRYIKDVWPGTRVDVVEIDPKVTQAAMAAYGLAKDTTIRTIHMDARNYIDALTIAVDDPKIRYNFIYEDAINNYSVPFQLVTREFNEKISQVLTDDGVYMLNIIDIYQSGRFLGALLTTLKQTFGSIHVFSENAPLTRENNFVIIASKQQVDLQALDQQPQVRQYELKRYGPEQIKQLMEKADRMVLTDNFAPVENLVAPAVLKSGEYKRAMQYIEKGQQYENQSMPNSAFAMYEKAIDICPELSFEAYNKIGSIHIMQKNWRQAIETAQQVLAYNRRAGLNWNLPNIYAIMGFAYQQLGQAEQARNCYTQAIEGYRQELRTTNAASTYQNLGDVYAKMGDFSRAATCFQKAVVLEPNVTEHRLFLAKALLRGNSIEQAREVIREGLKLTRQSSDMFANRQFQQLLEQAEVLRNQNP